MISIILKTRAIQLIRLIKSVGFLLLLVFVPLAGIAFLGLFQMLSNSDPMYLAAGIPAVIGMLHFYRKDGRFLQLTFSKKEVFKILLIEYSVAAGLFCLLFGIALKAWGFVPIAISASTMISFFPFAKKSNRNSFSWLPLNWLPTAAFEWRWAFRKMGIMMLPIWAAGFLGIKFTGAPILSLMLFSITLCSAFEYLENKELIAATGYDSSFLLKKVGLHLMILHLIFLPQHLIFFIFHFQYWYIHLVAMIAVSLLLSFAIFKKYSEYAPRRVRTYNGTQIGIFVLFATVPFLMPAAVAQIFFFYRKAKRNMDFYFREEERGIKSQVENDFEPDS